jgi:hypothetical protein
VFKKEGRGSSLSSSDFLYVRGERVPEGVYFIKYSYIAKENMKG